MKIDRLLALEMPALHEHRARAELRQRLALARHVRFASRNPLAEQRRGLGEVRSEAIDERQQARPDRLDKARAAQRVAGGGDHDGS